MPTINAQGQKQYAAGEAVPTIANAPTTPPVGATPIVGTPTTSFQTINGVNYAAAPINAGDLQTPTGGTPTITHTTDASTGLSIAANGVVNGANPSTPALSSIDPNASPTDQVKAALQIEKTRGDFTEAAQKEQDLSGKTAALNEANKAILNASKSFNDEIASIKTQAGLSPAQLAAKINNVTQRKAETLANLGIAAQVAQGDITAATTIIDQKVKAKFEPVDNYIKSLETYQNFYNEDLTSKQKMELQLRIDDAKAKKTANAKAYDDTLKALRDAGAPASAYAAVDEAASKPDANPASISASAGTIIAPNDQAVPSDTLNGMLNVYKTTGVLPSFGMSGKSPLRAQFYAALGGKDGNEIVTSANTNKALRAGLATAYKTQQNQLSANQTAIGTLDKQLELVSQYNDDVLRTNSPIVNKYLLGLKSGVFGDAKAAALNNIVKTASYEFAKILSGSAASIAGVTVSSAADAESMLNSAMSKGQFKEILGLMKKESQFRLDSQKETLAQIEKDLNNVGDLKKDIKQEQTYQDWLKSNGLQ